MKYSTRSYHPAEGPCEFTIFDKDPYGKTQPTAVISAVGRMCTEHGTNWPSGSRSSSLSQAVLSPNDAVGMLKQFRGNHSLVDETIPEARLRKWAPELGALMGFAPEGSEVEAALAIDTNDAVAEEFGSTMHRPQFES